MTTTRSDIPDATPALQAEMMEVVNRGIENYNRNMGSEQVPVGAKSLSELSGRLRMYNPDKHSWIPTYYREAMLKGFEAWAAIVDRITDGKPTTLDSINHPELVKLVKAKKALQQGVSDRTKAELQAKFSKEEMPAAYKDGLINPDYARMKKSELEYSIKKVANDMPLQDFAETTRLMHREVMAKAVELGVDRVTFVQSKDTHPDVQMRNERGAALYDRDIPAMVNGELKKFGTELKPANNIDQSPNYPSSPSHDEHTMLSQNLGYDITSQMAEAVAKSQPTYKVADEGNRGSVLSRMESKASQLTDLIAGYQKTINRLKGSQEPKRKRQYQEAVQGRDNAQADLRLITEKKRVVSEGGAFATSDYGMLGEESKPDLKPFEGNFKVSDAVKKGVIGLDEIIGRLTKTDNISPSLRDAMKALKDAVRKQDATDEVLIPELREAYDTMVRSIDDQMAGASLTPIDSLKEIQKALKPLDKKIQKNSERIQKNARDAQEADMAEGADVEGQGIQERQAAGRRDMEEGASLESDQATAEIDRRRGDARLDVEEGASLDADEATARIQETVQDTNDGADIEAGQTQASRQNLPRQFPNPAPPVPAGLPSYKPSGVPAFPRPPATPALPQVKPSGAVPFPRPPTAPAVPRGSIAPPPPQGTPAPNPLAPSLEAAKPLSKLSAWRGWTLEKGLNGGFWKNAVGWMIVVQADKFKVYNPQRAMQGIYEDLEAAKRRVQRAEPKQ